MAYTISMNRGAFLSFAFLFLQERFWEIPEPTVGHGRDGSMTLWPEPCFRPGFGMDFRVGSCCNSSLSALAIFTLWFLRNIAGLEIPNFQSVMSHASTFIISQIDSVPGVEWGVWMSQVWHRFKGWFLGIASDAGLCLFHGSTVVIHPS